MLVNKFLTSTAVRAVAGEATGAAATGAVAGAAAAGPAAAAAAPAPFAALPADVMTFLTGQGVADVPSLATKFKDVSTRLGGSVELPKPDATLEQRAPFYEKVRPAKADDYQFALPQGLPEGFPYDQELAKGARTAFHKLGLDPVQAKGVHDWYVENMAGGFKNSVAETVKAEENAHNAVVAKWGAPETDTYKTNMQLAGRAAKELGVMDSLKAHGLLSADGGIKDASIAFALAHVGGALYKEDSTPRNGGAAMGVNPWAKETWNETQQGDIYKADKARASSLITAAGLKPADFGL